MDFGWIWIGIIILAVIAELTTDQLIAIWFIPGAIISTILNFFGLDIIWQILIFLAVSLLGIFLIRRLLVSYTAKNNKKTNFEAIIGEKCVVTEKISNFAGCGQVKVRGQIWSARGCFENDEFEVGEVLQIVAIEGVKVICKK